MWLHEVNNVKKYKNSFIMYEYFSSTNNRLQFLPKIYVILWTKYCVILDRSPEVAMFHSEDMRPESLQSLSQHFHYLRSQPCIVGSPDLLRGIPTLLNYDPCRFSLQMSAYQINILLRLPLLKKDILFYKFLELFTIYPLMDNFFISDFEFLLNP